MRYSMLSSAVFAALTISVQANASLPGYNFDYEILGDKSIRPVQVFDNGQSIYIQMSARSRNPPAVMERNGSHVAPVTFRYEYPYLVVDNTRGQIVLALDGRTVTVTKRASGTLTGAASPIFTGEVARVGAPVSQAVQHPPTKAIPAKPAESPAPDYSGEMIYRNVRSSAPVALPPVAYAPAPPAPLPPVARSSAPVALPPVAYAPAPPAPVARAPAPAMAMARTSAIKVSAPAPARVSASITYTIKPGDTLYKIATIHGLPVAKVAKDNGIANPNMIISGRSLRIYSGSIMATRDMGGGKKNPIRLAAIEIKPLKLSRSGEEMDSADEALVDAVKLAVAKNGLVIIRGHSSADDQALRVVLANQRAEFMRDDLVAKGIPESKLVVAKNRGHVKGLPRVDVVLIGASKNA